MSATSVSEKRKPWAPIKFIKSGTPKKGEIVLFSKPKPDPVSPPISPQKPTKKRENSTPDEKTTKKWKGSWKPKIHKVRVRRDGLFFTKKYSRKYNF